MCQSNVLVTRDVPDATDILGEDYPYFARGNSDAELADAFAFARSTRGGPEWQHGLSIMKDVAERISGRALAREFRLLVQETA